MKILFSLTYFTPYVSGLTIHAVRLAELLADKGHKVSIITTQYPKSLKINEEIKKVNVTRVPYWFRLHKGFIMPKYFLYAIDEVKKVEVVVAHLPQVEGLIIALIAFILRKPFYCIYHCEVNLPNNIINKLINNLLNFINLIILFFAKNIITYTKDYADNSKVLKLFSNKLFYVLPPVPIPAKNNSVYNKIKYNLPKDNYIIGVAARFAAEKGIEYLLEAIPHLQKKLNKNFLIVFAGPKHPIGEEEYWKKMKSLIDKYSNHIYFLGTIPNDKMGSFYDLLDVLVLPSVNSTEAFGMVQVEAMLCGVPAVSSNLPGIRVPIIETGMGEIFEPRNSSDLAEKIYHVLINKKKYHKSQKQIAEFFSLPDSIEKYDRVFTNNYHN